MKKRIVAFVVSLVMLCALTAIPSVAADPRVWDGSVASGFSTGSGTRDNPYIISTAAELALFRDMVNEGNSSICAKMVNDIDLNDRSWEPIGMTIHGFTGMFDGGGWAVQNIRIDRVSEVIEFYNPHSERVMETQVAGLFGVVGANGHVRCVNISGKMSINKTYSNDTGIYIGAVAGDNHGYIEECFSTCTFDDFYIKNNNYIGVGGIVGNNKFLVANCFNTGEMNLTLKGTKSSHKHYIGGIVGYDYGSTYGGGVFNCYNAAPMNISSSSNSSGKRFGGVIGAELQNSGLVNNYYDKQECKMSACVGSDSSGDKILANQNPPSNHSLETWTMHAPDFVQTLGNAYSFDINNLNKGYPILSVMTYHETSDWSEWFDDEVGGTEIDKEVYNRLYPAELLNKDLTKPITRVEFAAVALKLYEEMGGEKLTAAELSMPFHDTSSDVIRKAYNLGIVNGISATEFDPYSKISRQDLATMLTRAYKKLSIQGWTLADDTNYVLDYNVDKVFADDGEISAYAKPSVYFMVANNVIKGISENYFGPRNTSSRHEAENYANATREQALIMAVRSFKNLSK